MSDNIVPFRRPAPRPEPPERRPRGPLPGWVPFAVLVLLGIVISLVQQSGFFA